MARRSWHKSEDTRTEILDEAERQLVSAGYHGMTIDSLARKLGMSPANIFKNFGNKAGLIDALALRWVVKTDEMLDVTETITPASTRLRTIARLILDSHLRDGDVLPKIAILAGVAAAPPPSAIAFFERLLERLRRLIEAGIAEGEYADCDATARAAVVCDCMITVLDPASVLRARTMFSCDEITRRGDQLVDFVIAGLRAGA